MISSHFASPDDQVVLRLVQIVSLNRFPPLRPLLSIRFQSIPLSSPGMDAIRKKRKIPEQYPRHMQTKRPRACRGKQKDRGDAGAGGQTICTSRRNLLTVRKIQKRKTKLSEHEVRVFGFALILFLRSVLEIPGAEAVWPPAPASPRHFYPTSRGSLLCVTAALI